MNMDVPATKVSATRTCPDLPGDLPYRLEEFSPDDIEYELEEMESRNLRLIENWQASGIFLRLVCLALQMRRFTLKIKSKLMRYSM